MFCYERDFAMGDPSLMASADSSFLRLHRRGFPVGQQRNNGSQPQHNATDPDPHHKRIQVDVKCSRSSGWIGRCGSLEHEVNIFKQRFANGDLADRLFILSAFVSPSAGIHVGNLFSVLVQAHIDAIARVILTLHRFEPVDADGEAPNLKCVSDAGFKF